MPSTTSRTGFWAGLLVFAVLLVLPPPDGLSVAGARTLAAGSLMGVWWITEAIPIPATSLLPLVLFPALGIVKIDDAATPYANPLIFLFMGGFMLALAMERWNLHRRIALGVAGAMGTRPSRLVLGLMSATAFLSMWMSNTATAVMMLPIGISLLELADREGGLAPGEREAFSNALVLGIAYAASIGGLGTLIGTPPNALFAAYMRSAHGIDISFASWMAVGVPLVAVLLPAAWLLLTRVLYRMPGQVIAGGEAWLRDERARLGSVKRAEVIVALAFGGAAVLWIGAPLAGLKGGPFTDAGIAMTAGLLLFILPSGDEAQPKVLTWDVVERLPWGALLLFGGGLSLADALAKTGLADWAGTTIGALGGLPFSVLLVIVVVVIVALSEVASNTATAAAFLPVAAVLAAALGRDAISLTLPVALAASCGFMLPVATPPNTLAYGTGRVGVRAMARAGFWIDVIGIAAVVGAVYLLGPVAFGH